MNSLFSQIMVLKNKSQSEVSGFVFTSVNIFLRKVLKRQVERFSLTDKSIVCTFQKKVWYSYKTFCTWITIMNYKNSSGQKNIKNILVIKCYERERIITSFLSNAWPLDTTKISKSDISIHTTPEQACLS